MLLQRVKHQYVTQAFSLSCPKTGKSDTFFTVNHFLLHAHAVVFGIFVVSLNAKSANKTTKQQDKKPTRFVWKTIPSKARVTRDEVSGLPKEREWLSGIQYQIMNYELCIMNYAL